VAGHWKLFRRAGFTFQHSRFLSERTITLIFSCSLCGRIRTTNSRYLTLFYYLGRNNKITLMDTYTRRGNGNIISPKKNLKGVNFLVYRETLKSFQKLLWKKFSETSVVKRFNHGVRFRFRVCVFFGNDTIPMWQRPARALRDGLVLAHDVSVSLLVLSYEIRD